MSTLDLFGMWIEDCPWNNIVFVILWRPQLKVISITQTLSGLKTAIKDQKYLPTKVMEYLRKCLFFLSLLFAPVPQFIALVCFQTWFHPMLILNFK